MIITMKKSANLAMVETVAIAFERAGYDVQIKNHMQPSNKTGIIMAILGKGIKKADTLFFERLPGIEKIEKDNAFFVANHEEFVEAWQFFNEKDKL